MEPCTSCDLCPLKREGTRLGTVPGEGEVGGIFVVGEGPGPDEFRQGRPFVGRSGKLLRETLSQLGYTHVWFANSTLCWPGSIQAPTEEMIGACRERLFEEVRSVDPKIVIACGATAFRSLLPNVKENLLKVRGRVFETDLGKVIPTVHPAYVLRNPESFKDFVRDISLIDRVLSPSHIEPPKVELVTNSRDVYKMLTNIPSPDQTTHAVCDIETNSLDEFDPEAEIVCIGLCFDPSIVYVITQDGLKSQFVRDQVKGVLERGYHWTGHNAYQFDVKWLRVHLATEWKPDFDTMLAHYTLDERQSGHSLKALATEYFGAPDYASEVKANEYWNDPSSMARQKLYEYQAWDCLYTWLLRPELQKEMDLEDVRRVHDKVVLPAARTLGEIEQTGVLLDRDHLELTRAEMKRKSERLLESIRVVAEDDAFNPSSPIQVKQLLNGKLGILPIGFDTSAESLGAIEKRHPVVRDILDYRQCVKVVSTYIDGMIARISPTTGRLHADFNIMGTRTGRLSSSSPNLQNIPQVMGPLIRNAFIPTPGWLMGEADGSQLELRVLAYLSGDANLIQAYRDGRDIHREVGSVMFHVPYTEVTEEQRYLAKYCDFGVIYGRQAQALADAYDMPLKEAQEFIDTFLGGFPGVRQFIRDQHKFVKENKFVATAFGRRRRFPCIVSNNINEVERQSVNSSIQGTASDICLTAITRLHSRFDPREARVLLTVHDSLLFEYREEVEAKIFRMIQEEWEKNTPLDSPVTFKAEIKRGTRWGELVKIDLNKYFDK